MLLIKKTYLILEKLTFLFFQMFKKLNYKKHITLRNKTNKQKNLLKQELFEEY